MTKRKKIGKCKNCGKQLGWNNEKGYCFMFIHYQHCRWKYPPC